MIEVLPDTAAMCYVGFLLIGLFGIWTYDWWKEKKKSGTSHPMGRKVHCEFCGHSFRTHAILPLVECPLCKLLIKISEETPV